MDIRLCQADHIDGILGMCPPIGVEERVRQFARPAARAQAGIHIQEGAGRNPFFHHIVVHHKAVADVRHERIGDGKAPRPVAGDGPVVVFIDREPNFPQSLAAAEVGHKGDAVGCNPLAPEGLFHIDFAEEQAVPVAADAGVPGLLAVV